MSGCKQQVFQGTIDLRSEIKGPESGVATEMFHRLNESCQMFTATGSEAEERAARTVTSQLCLCSTNPTQRQL